MLLKTVSGVILVPKHVFFTQKIIWSQFGAHMAMSILDHFGPHRQLVEKLDFEITLKWSKLNLFDCLLMEGADMT